MCLGVYFMKCSIWHKSHQDEVEVQENKSPTPSLFTPQTPILKKESLVCFTGHAEEAGIALTRTGRFSGERASG